MMRRRNGWIGMAAALGMLAAPMCLAQQMAVTPATMQKIGTVDERFQSYNIEMLEVTGGRFWAPYKDHKEETAAPAAKLEGPVGIDPSGPAPRWGPGRP